MAGSEERRARRLRGQLLGAGVALVLAAATTYAADPPPAGDPPTPPVKGDVATGFVPPVAPIEKPYTNDKCLANCHGVPGFGAGGPSGIARTLHVDQTEHLFSTHAQKGVECVDCHIDADPNQHPRTGYPGVDCRACHSSVPPDGAYPPDAWERLAKKGIKPPPQESRKGEGWIQTKHAQAWVAGNPAAPFCSHCHTAHYVRRSAEPASTVHRSQLAETCGGCHPGQVRAYGVGGYLARIRIGAHGKGDLSERYAVTECLSCHPKEGAHGEEPAAGAPACPTCHRVPEQPDRADYASLHIQPTSPDQPLTRVLRWVYEGGFWAVAAGGAVVALFLGFSSRYRKPEEEGEA